jgi:hypothetical protein
MAKYVQEIINPELFFLGPRAAVGLARSCILALGITGCPVLDPGGYPIGMVSLRDVLNGRAETVDERMSHPVETIAASATIDDAGKALARTGLHRLVVVDAERRAIGIVSALDVVRGLLGMPIHFSEAFEHRAGGLVWKGDFELSTDGIASAPDASGLIIVTHGRPGVPNVPVWVGMAKDLRATLTEMVDRPETSEPGLALWLERHADQLSYRTAVVEDDARRDEALEELYAATRIRAWARDLE